MKIALILAIALCAMVYSATAVDTGCCPDAACAAVTVCPPEQKYCKVKFTVEDFASATCSGAPEAADSLEPGKSCPADATLACVIPVAEGGHKDTKRTAAAAMVPPTAAPAGPGGPPAAPAATTAPKTSGGTGSPAHASAKPGPGAGGHAATTESGTARIQMNIMTAVYPLAAFLGVTLFSFSRS